jgi:hypothetical protein
MSGSVKWVSVLEIEADSAYARVNERPLLLDASRKRADGPPRSGHGSPRPGSVLPRSASGSPCWGRLPALGASLSPCEGRRPYLEGMVRRLEGRFPLAGGSVRPAGGTVRREGGRRSASGGERRRSRGKLPLLGRATHRSRGIVHGSCSVAARKRMRENELDDQQARDYHAHRRRLCLMQDGSLTIDGPQNRGYGSVPPRTRPCHLG